jgi:hypothetical protein
MSHLWRSSLIVVFAAALLACGSTPNYYRRATAKQEQCCNRVGDPAAKSACLGEVPRLESVAAETTPTNQETFRCVDRHFACDASTGRATRESAQGQLDCLNDLESTR